MATRPQLDWPIITTDLAVMGNTSARTARLREDHIWPVVFDAMTLIRDAIHNTIPGKEPSALMDALKIGTARLYGKPDLLEEVADHLPEMVARKGYDLDRVRAVLASYVSRMRLVDATGVLIPEDEERFAKVGARREPDARSDEPTARLTRLLDPSILFTTDLDLLDYCFGVWYEPGERVATWTAAAFTLKDRAFGSQMESGMKVANFTFGVPILAGIQIVKAARAHPQMALAVGAIAFVFVATTRKSPRWRSAGDALSKNMTQIVADLSERMPEDLAARQRAAHVAAEQLEDYRNSHASPGSPVALIARTLSIAPTMGLTAKEIYNSTGNEFAVLRVLEKYPALFTRAGGGRWLLGIPAFLPERPAAQSTLDLV